MKFWRQPYFWAIFLHCAALTGLGFYALPSSLKKQAAVENGAAASEGMPLYSASSPPFSGGTLERRLESSLQSAERLSPGAKLDAASSYARQLESISSAKSMKEIGAYFGSSSNFNAPKGLYEPGKEREFDHSSSMPVGAKLTAGGKYVFVFRDANNNSFEAPAAPGDELAAQAFALLDRSDVLREFKTSILLPALNERLERR